MRISLEEDSNKPEFVKHLLSIRVFLDGKNQPDCIVADEEEGYIIIIPRFSTGICYESDPREIITEVRKGVVRIEVPEELRLFAEGNPQ